MSNRLNKQREQILQPIRIERAFKHLIALGLIIETRDSSKIIFIFKNNKITYYPYSGWHSGKGIKDGRGWANLKKQLI